MSNFKIAALAQLAEIQNAHLQGVKRVFVANEESDTQLTQFAYGTFLPNQESGLHSHKTMEEYFYFLKGTGHIVIAEEQHPTEVGTFLKIPAGVPHNLVNSGSQDLEFVYFGVATA